MQRSPPKTFDEILPISTQTSSSKISYQVNINRQKTRKWAEAKPVSYDGEDWGYRDENTTWKQQDLPQDAQDLDNSIDLESSVTSGAKPQKLADSFKKHDEKRLLSFKSKEASSTSLIHKPSSLGSWTHGISTHGTLNDTGSHSKAQSSSGKRNKSSSSPVLSAKSLSNPGGHLDPSIDSPSTTEPSPLAYRSSLSLILPERPPNSDPQTAILNQVSIPELESFSSPRELPAVDKTTENYLPNALSGEIVRKTSVTSLKSGLINKSSSSTESDSSKKVPRQETSALSHPTQISKLRIDYDISIMKDSVSPEVDNLSTSNTELIIVPSSNERLQSDIVRKLSSRPSDEEKISQILTLDTGKVEEIRSEDKNPPAEQVNEITSTTTSDNSINSEPSTIYIAPLSPRRKSHDLSRPWPSDEAHILPESNSSIDNKENLSNIQPINTVEASVAPEILGRESSRRISEVSEKSLSTTQNLPLNPRQTAQIRLEGDCFVEATHLTSTNKGFEANLSQKLPAAGQEEPFASRVSSFSSPTGSENHVESSPQSQADQQLQHPVSSVFSLFKTSDSPVGLPTNTQSFQEILALRSPSDRIRSFDEAREKYYNIEYGLGSWILQVKSQNPEYDNVTSHFPGPRSSVVSGYGLSRSKFAKVTGSSPLFQASHHQNFLSNNTNTMPITSNIRYGAETSVPISHQISPVSNKPPSNHLQARGKDFFHTAGMISGKAGKAGKGLLAKGKNRLRAAGGGDKDKENPAITRIKPERRASWGLPLIITRISGKRDSFLHETNEIDPSSITFSHSVSKTWTSPAPNQIPNIEAPLISARSVTINDTSKKSFLHKSKKTKTASSQTQLPSDVKNTTVSGSSHFTHKSETFQDSGSKPSGFEKDCTQSVEHMKLKKTASPKEEVVESPSFKGLLQNFKKPMKGNNHYPNKVTKFLRENSSDRVYQSNHTVNSQPLTQTSKDTAFKYTVKAKKKENAVEPQRPKSYINDKSLPSLPSLPLIPPLTLPSSITPLNTPILTSEVQDVVIDHQKLRPHVLTKKRQARHSMIEGLSSQQIERNKIESLKSKRRNSNTGIDLDEKQDRGYQLKKKEVANDHHTMKARFRDSPRQTSSKKRVLDESFAQKGHDLDKQPTKSALDRSINLAPHAPKPLNTESSNVSSSHSNKLNRRAGRENGEMLPRSTRLAGKSQINRNKRRPKACISIPKKDLSKDHHSCQSCKSNERQSHLRSKSSLDHPNIRVRPERQPPSSAQRYREFFRTDTTTVETEVTDKKDLDVTSKKDQSLCTQAPTVVSQNLAYENLTLDPVRPASADFVSRHKPANKLLKDISGRIYSPSRNKRRHSSEFFNNSLNLGENNASLGTEYINSSVTPKVEMKGIQYLKTMFFSGENHTTTQDHGSTYPIRRNNSVHDHYNSQAPDASLPSVSPKKSSGLHHKYTPTGYQFEVSDQADPKIGGERQLSIEVTKNLINTGTHSRRNTQPSFASQKSQDIVPTAVAIPHKRSGNNGIRRSSGSGLFNGFFGLLTDKVDQQIDYSHKLRSQGIQRMSVTQEKTSFDQSRTLTQAKRVVPTHYQSELPPFSFNSFTPPPDKQKSNSLEKKPSPPNKVHLGENKYSPVFQTSCQSTISPVSSMSSLRASEIGTLLTVSACSPVRQARSSGFRATQVNSKYMSRSHSLETIRPNNRLDGGLNVMKASYDLVKNIHRKGSSEMNVPLSETTPMQSFLLSDQETINSSREISRINVNDVDFDESRNKQSDTGKVEEFSETNLYNIKKLNSNETGVVMKATSYPGQEWNPYLAGA
ncbi:hypothetical protein K3495_g2578 [Podosphaera aphanis]|nr:hypothetical protein K3495_g2578 [Podosphaera aphanis]